MLHSPLASVSSIRASDTKEDARTSNLTTFISLFFPYPSTEEQTVTDLESALLKFSNCYDFPNCENPVNERNVKVSNKRLSIQDVLVAFPDLAVAELQLQHWLVLHSAWLFPHREFYLQKSICIMI